MTANFPDIRGRCMYLGSHVAWLKYQYHSGPDPGDREAQTLPASLDASIDIERWF